MDEHETIRGLCEQAVDRLAISFPDAEVTCLLRREDDLLRMVAHRGRLRVIYEFPREQGGVVWRTVDQGATQTVADVRSDPDYIAADEGICWEVAVPLRAGDRVVGVLNVEAVEGRLDGAHAAALEREVERLEGGIAPFCQSPLV